MIDTDDGYGNSDRYRRRCFAGWDPLHPGFDDPGPFFSASLPEPGKKVRPRALSDRPQISEM